MIFQKFIYMYLNLELEGKTYTMLQECGNIR